MTRIVAGLARGRRLAVPTHGTRPTSDRARGALFDSLGHDLDIAGARFLDLYAGSGAVGLEALSRGASEVVLVESDRAAAAVLADNIRAVGLPGATLVRTPVASYLAGPPSPFDAVFADPPYDTRASIVAELLTALGGPGWVVSGGIVVIERSARDPEPVWPSAINPIKQRRYGAGTLWYGRRE